MYEGLKHFHLLTIALSATLLSVRFALLMANSPLRENKFLKIFPHIVDSALLISGAALIVGFIPWSSAPWLSSKLTCVLAYIALGFFALKLAKNNWLRVFAFFGALGWLMMASKIAITKTPLLF